MNSEWTLPIGKCPSHLPTSYVRTVRTMGAVRTHHVRPRGSHLRHGLLWEEQQLPQTTTMMTTVGAQETVIVKITSARTATKTAVTKKKEHAVILEIMHLIVVAEKMQKQTMKL